MTEELMFVQFPHPGAEHQPKGDEMGWNRGEHRRKFLKADAEYLAEGLIRSGPVAFWGEWEPPSRVVERFDDPAEGMPRFLHEPLLAVPNDTNPRQNTDPLVFGDRFMYSNCRQPRNANLRRLAPGSLILFGSSFRSEFVLDTVFVVDSGEDFAVASSAGLDRTEWVQDAVFEPLRLARPSAAGQFRLYRGRPCIEGEIFSFVPCRPLDAGPPLPFARPAIRLDEQWLSPRLSMAAKASSATANELRQLWAEVVDQVLAAPGLTLATRIEVPRRLRPASKQP